jgi:transcriptional regulator with XRE-family HTH domain
MKTEERTTARQLRQLEGRSIKEIAALVGVSVSSVSHWVRDIELTDAQVAALVARNPALNGQLTGVTIRSAQARAVREACQAEGRALARRRDPLHAAGCMLYWAEGSKSRNAVQFTNSDPAMVAFFVGFLRTCYQLPDEAFRVACNLFADHVADRTRIEQFWLDTLHLPRSCLRKSIVNVYSKHSQRKRRNVLPYGTCRVCVHRTAVVQSIYGSIQEYGGFERSGWLD